uniref:Uncharacterized protein n=1 Tax=Panagrolaimus sp. PS1159 TaxID=55785 RepID=A0AC35FR50_9BILA
MDNNIFNSEILYTFYGISIISTLFFISTFICGQKREPPRPTSKRSKKAATNQSSRSTAPRSQPKSSSSPIQKTATTQDGTCPKSNNKFQGSVGGGSTGEKPTTTTTTTTTEQQSDETQQSVDQSVDMKSIDNKKPETSKKKSVRSNEIPIAADKNKQKSVKSVKEKSLIRNEAQSNRSTKTARQQQSSIRAASTQQPSSSNRVATTQRSTKDEDYRPSQKQKSADEIVQPSSRRTPAIPPPRDSERDKQIAAKALKFIRARRAQNNFSTRERNYESSSSLKEEKEPDNTVEGQVLSKDEERGGNNSKNKSATLPSGETPEAGQKIGGVEEIEKEVVDEDTKKEIQQHYAQAGIYVPPEKRQFRPCSEIPSDDLTVKREVRKKKKKQKKKNKKKSNSSSDDKNNNKKE